MNFYHEKGIQFSLSLSSSYRLSQSISSFVHQPERHRHRSPEMASGPMSTHQREPWQRCADKLNQSTMNMRRRSTSLWHHSKHRRHQTTAEAWHRSTDWLSRSKNLCQQSTVNVLNRSANKWHQSTECLHRLSLTSKTEGDGKSEKQVSAPGESPPNARSGQVAQSHDDIRSFNSPPSLSSNPTERVTYTAHPVQDPMDHTASAEEQIRDILNSTDQLMYQANHTKQLKASKVYLLGEIEHDWISATISEANSAARDLAKLVEPYRLDMLKRKGQMRSAHRKSWRLVDYQSACERRSSLVLHQEKLEVVSRHLEDVSELKQNSPNESNADVVSELSAGTRDPSLGVIELPSEGASTTPQSDTTLVELPGNTPTKTLSTQPLPIIIVTQAQDDPLREDMEYSEEIYTSKNEETNEILYWEQTRDNIRLQ